MPRFYFHVYDDVAARDEEGRDLPDAAAAVLEARRSIGALAAEQVIHGRLVLYHLIEVEDENGRCVATVRIRDVVKVVP